ncbi:MAG: hypothetical protein FJW90_10445, partial [Actinobacteria bacterium]|nr:hypothetical protein [Actinomycetota bacterium]
MNHRNVPDDAVIRYTVTYEDDPVGQGMTTVTPWRLDVLDCRADPIYNVPGARNRKKARKQGATHTLSRDYTIPAGGRVVGGAGHVHGGAYKLMLTQPE